MTQYIKTYEHGPHLINLDYVKEIYVSSTVYGESIQKELIFKDAYDNIILQYKGQTNGYIDECFSKIEKFIEAQEDRIYNLY